MLSFGVGKEIEKGVFSSFHEREVPMRNRTSGLRILRYDALTLSHTDSVVSYAHYEAHI